MNEQKSVNDTLIPCQYTLENICEQFFNSKYWIDKAWIDSYDFKGALECYLNEDVKVTDSKDWETVYGYMRNYYMEIRINFLKSEIELLSQLTNS